MSNDENASTSQLSLTGRATWLPVSSDKRSRLIHLVLPLSSRSPTGGDVRCQSRPEARFVDFRADSVRLLAAELAAVDGPQWAAAEYIVSHVAAELSGELTDISAALNWHPNATVRVGLDCVVAQPQDRGSAHIAVLRFQYNPW